MEPSFDYRLVYDKFKRVSSAVRLTDITDLVATLALRKEATGLAYFTEDDGEGRLHRLFVEQAGAQDCWGTRRKRLRCGKVLRNVLQFDPTWGSNCYGMKLSMFITVAEDGSSTILAYLIHHEEDFEDVYWGFRCFHTVFKIAPATLMTDSGPGIVKAAARMMTDLHPWSETAHLLCVYHIDQNFFTNLHCLFAARPEEWKILHNMFWRVGKDYDEHQRQSLDDRLAAMRAYIVANGKGNSKDAALAWYDNVLIAKVEKWAACLTWRYFSAGAHATVRSEKMNHILKDWLLSNSSLTDVQKKVELYQENKQHRDLCKVQAARVKELKQKDKGHGAILPPFLTEARAAVSEYAYDLMRPQFAQVHAYTHRPVPDDDPRSDKSRGEPKGTNFFVERIVSEANGILTDETAPQGPDGGEVGANGKTKSHENKTDYGFYDTCLIHWVSADRCSCQYLMSYGVLCRHIFHVRLFKPLPDCTPLQDLCAERWRIRDEADFCEECEEEGEDVPAEDTSTEPSKCLAGLSKVLRENGYETTSGVDPDKLQIDTYDGYHIAIKYGNRKQAGWYIARMETTENGAVMKLHFELSNKYEVATWPTEFMVAHMIAEPTNFTAMHPKKSWLLVHQKPVGTGSVTANPQDRAPGRPQEKRRAPFAGPLSNK
jgi:hypothetical protein